jgi:hypothetical protein
MVEAFDEKGKSQMSNRKRRTFELFKMVNRFQRLAGEQIKDAMDHLHLRNSDVQDTEMHLRQSLRAIETAESLLNSMAHVYEDDTRES